MNLSTKKTLQPQELSEQEELGDVQILLMTMKIVILIDWPKNLFTKKKKVISGGVIWGTLWSLSSLSYLFKKFITILFSHLKFWWCNRKLLCTGWVGLYIWKIQCTHTCGKNFRAKCIVLCNTAIYFVNKAFRKMCSSGGHETEPYK